MKAIKAPSPSPSIIEPLKKNIAVLENYLSMVKENGNENDVTRRIGETLESFKQALTNIESESPVKPAPETVPTKKPAKPKKLHKYGFNLFGQTQLYKLDEMKPEQWEALKVKLGGVFEVEAANQAEAWRLWENRKQG